MTAHSTPPAAPAGYFEDLASKALAPGWAKREPQMWPAPRSKYVPAVWRYADARKALDTAGEFVSPEQAERRNLILVDPIEGNVYPSTRHLVAAYQLVLPGETAHAHRHSPNAIRIILDVGADTYTVVNGTRVDLAKDDVVLTPTWHWHDHSNLGDTSAFWIDILDVPLVQNLENIYFEEHPELDQKVIETDPNSSLRAKGVDIAKATQAHGSYEIAPGGIATMSIKSLGFKAGEKVNHPKRIINRVYAVLAGRLKFDIEGLGEVELTRGDIVVVPTWHKHSVEGLDAYSQVIQVTDEPVFEKLGFTEVRRSGE
jgi:gentisate 1,2-dioxygenase